MGAPAEFWGQTVPQLSDSDLKAARATVLHSWGIFGASELPEHHYHWFLDLIEVDAEIAARAHA